MYYVIMFGGFLTPPPPYVINTWMIPLDLEYVKWNRYLHETSNVTYSQIIMFLTASANIGISLHT